MNTITFRNGLTLRLSAIEGVSKQEYKDYDCPVSDENFASAHVLKPGIRIILHSSTEKVAFDTEEERDRVLNQIISSINNVASALL